MSIRHMAYLIISFILGVIVTVMFYSWASPSTEKGTIGPYSVRSELAPIALKAVLGDKEASAGMNNAMTSDCAYSTGGRGSCEDARRVFAMVDAENGNPDGMIAYASLIARSSYCVDLYRAKFWFRRAENLGRKTLDNQATVDKRLTNCR